MALHFNDFMLKGLCVLIRVTIEHMLEFKLGTLEKSIFKDLWFQFDMHVYDFHNKMHKNSLDVSIVKT